MDNRKWARQQIEALINLGTPPTEAMDTVALILDTKPPNVDPAEHYPDTLPVGENDSRDTEIARGHWQQQAPDRVRYLLDALDEPNT